MSSTSPPVIRPPERLARPVASVGRRCASWAASSLVALALIGIWPAHAEDIPPGGEEVAKPAVVSVETAFAFDVVVTGRNGKARIYNARVAGPRGTGVVINSSGAVLTGQDTAFPQPGRQQEITAINRAFRSAFTLPWTEGQLGRELSFGDPALNGELQRCYRQPDLCLQFAGPVRSVVYNTEPVRRLDGPGIKIGDDLALVSTPVNLAPTPTAAVAAGPPHDDGSYMALGWTDQDGQVAIPVTLEKAQPIPADLRKIEATFANQGDGAVIVDRQDDGTVVTVVRRNRDGILTGVAPDRPLVSSNTNRDLGPLHQRIRDAVREFQAHRFANAVPLLEEVTRVLPDRGLRRMLETARLGQNKPGDTSTAAAEPAASPPRPSRRWLILAAGIAISAAIVAGTIVGLRKRTTATFLAFRRR